MSSLSKIIEDTYTWQVKLLKKGGILSIGVPNGFAHE